MKTTSILSFAALVACTLAFRAPEAAIKGSPYPWRPAPSATTSSARAP